MRMRLLLLTGLLNLGGSALAQVPVHTADPDSCDAFPGVGPGHKWLSGDYTVVPVAQEQQSQWKEALKPGQVKEVGRRAARAASGGAALPKAAHYYLIRIGYVGDWSFAENVSMSADVDAEGVAYVTTFVLTHSHGRRELAAVLASPTPLKRVVPICMAAE